MSTTSQCPDTAEVLAPESAGGRPADEWSARFWDLEFLLTVTNNAFQRWAVRCMASAGEEGLAPLEVMVLHAVNRRARHGTVSDLALLLNLDDNHLINYALKKLEARDLVKAEKRGKEKVISVTSRGASVCEAYIATRERCLMQMLRATDTDTDPEELERLARILRLLAGSFDHAARAAIGH